VNSTPTRSAFFGATRKVNAAGPTLPTPPHRIRSLSVSDRRSALRPHALTTPGRATRPGASTRSALDCQLPGARLRGPWWGCWLLVAVELVVDVAAGGVGVTLTLPSTSGVAAPDGKWAGSARGTLPMADPPTGLAKWTSGALSVDETHIPTRGTLAESDNEEESP